MRSQSYHSRRSQPRESAIKGSCSIHQKLTPNVQGMLKPNVCTPMMFLGKGIYAVVAALVVCVGAFEPDTADSVFIKAPVSATAQIAHSSLE